MYEAYWNRTGLRLSVRDVAQFMSDEAIATRVTNKACIEAGIDELGSDEATKTQATWSGFCRYIKDVHFGTAARPQGEEDAS